MLLIVGLGNPGDTYENTRHNVGFLAVNALQKNYDLPDFKLDKKPNALTSKGIRSEQQILLAKPQTFMNNSGKAVKSLYTKYKIQDTRYLIVIHDDIDIALGKVKVGVGRGSAGHKGVDSIIQALGTKDFTRIRVGVQPEKGKPNSVESFVLKKFTQEELPLLQSAIQQATTSLTSLIG